MTRLVKFFVLLACGLCLARCTTTTGDDAATGANQLDKAPKPAPSPDSIPPPGIAFDYVLDHGAKTPPMRRCSVRFHHIGALTIVEARLIPEANKILVKVPVGDYAFLDASCDNGRRFAIPEFESFPVPKDGVVFLGEIRLIQNLAARNKEVDTLIVDDKDSEKNRDALAELKKRGLTSVWHHQVAKKKR